MKEILKKKHNKTRKKDKNDTKEGETREQQRLLTKTAEISGLHFPPSCVFLPFETSEMPVLILMLLVMLTPSAVLAAAIG